MQLLKYYLNVDLFFVFKPQTENTVLCWESVLAKDLKLSCEYIWSGLIPNVKSDLDLCVVEQVTSNKLWQALFDREVRVISSAFYW